METSEPKMMDGFEEHVVDGESREALPLTKTIEFCLVVVSIFDDLYEASGTSVYSKEDITKHKPSDAYRCFNYFVNKFPDTENVLRKIWLRKAIKKPMTYSVRFEEQWIENQSSTTGLDFELHF